MLRSTHLNATAYWLVPAKAERELFRDIIRILAQQFDAPLFEPHLTLFVASKKDRLPGKTLRAVNARPIRLQVREITWSRKFTKTLFVRFSSTPSLERLVAKLERESKTRPTSLRDPHLSLLYQKLPASMKKELASTIQLPFREVVFDSVKAVRCPSPTKTKADVESWRAVATMTLR